MKSSNSKNCLLREVKPFLISLINLSLRFKITWKSPSSTTIAISQLRFQSKRNSGVMFGRKPEWTSHNWFSSIFRSFHKFRVDNNNGGFVCCDTMMTKNGSLWSMNYIDVCFVQVNDWRENKNDKTKKKKKKKCLMCFPIYSKWSTMCAACHYEKRPAIISN